MMPKGKRFPLGYTAITRADVERVAAMGYTVSDAADILGIHRSTLWYYRKKWPGIKFIDMSQSVHLARQRYAR